MSKYISININKFDSKINVYLIRADQLLTSIILNKCIEFYWLMNL